MITFEYVATWLPEGQQNDWCPNFTENVNGFTQKMTYLEMNIKFVTWPNDLILKQTNKLSALIKNWIIGFGDFFGLVIMVTYEPL